MVGSAIFYEKTQTNPGKNTAPAAIGVLHKQPMIGVANRVHYYTVHPTIMASQPSQPSTYRRSLSCAYDSPVFSDRVLVIYGHRPFPLEESESKASGNKRILSLDEDQDKLIDKSQRKRLQQDIDRVGKVKKARCEGKEEGKKEEAKVERKEKRCEMKRLHVSGAILALESDFFRVMLTTPMMESDRNKPIEIEVVKQTINIYFLSCGDRWWIPMNVNGWLR